MADRLLCMWRYRDRNPDSPVFFFFFFFFFGGWVGVGWWVWWVVFFGWVCFWVWFGGLGGCGLVGVRLVGLCWAGIVVGLVLVW